MSEPLPAGYDAWRTYTPEQDCDEHLPDCDGDPAICACPTPQELQADASEARAAARDDR